ncbi:dehydrodolichyl diphosphate synthase complex subunit NUS1-like [Tubulanus polymorphus]|uniref:dehydrodolichyl diphosphate synthase complex subunit NUS1-like n=1 Tax=Tubulanus polymorphus TaxID=672921 RepID=UPI003DA286F6
MILKLFLIFLHLSISIKDFILSYVCWLNKPFEIFKKRKWTSDQLKKDAKSLSKLPLHLSFVIIEDKVSFADLASLIVWSMTMDISCVSIFDVQGVCKKNKSLLQHEIHKKQKDIIGSKYTRSQYIISNNDEELHNGCRSPCKSNIKLFSLEDGQRHLGETARKLCSMVSKSQFRMNDIVPDTINKLLIEHHGCQDPDLIIRFGKPQVMYGYLPWQIRLSQIQSHPSHLNIDYQSFLNHLQCYSSSHQRFGK